MLFSSYPVEMLIIQPGGDVSKECSPMQLLLLEQNSKEIKKVNIKYGKNGERNKDISKTRVDHDLEERSKLIREIAGLIQKGKEDELKIKLQNAWLL